LPLIKYFLFGNSSAHRKGAKGAKKKALYTTEGLSSITKPQIFRIFQHLLSEKYYLCALCAFAVNYYPFYID